MAPGNLGQSPVAKPDAFTIDGQDGSRVAYGAQHMDGETGGKRQGDAALD